MKVRAKFIIISAQPDYAGSDNIRIHATPTYSAEGENASFSKATPYGDLILGIDAGTPAIEFFKERMGKAVYLDFSEAPED